jgi:23S rRNA (adenine2503-C2)-methyltransferase
LYAREVIDSNHIIFPAKINLAGMHQNMLREFFSNIEEKPFRAIQVLKWIHKHGISDFASMTDLGKQLRDKLQQLAVVEFPKLVKQKVAKDGTHKWLVSVSGDNIIEMVFIPEKTRGTLCISSQVGCPINCAFCLTAKQGFNRNLTAAEIIGQVWLAIKLVQNINHPAVPVAKITNVVIMGMGEPLLNLDEVITATIIMRDDNAYNFARRRVTVSTSGIVPGIDKLSKLADVALALSLHAPNDIIRNKLVPLNRKYPIESLIEACKRYIRVSKIKSVTIEYVMMKGINDTYQHARQLIKILNGLVCKVNLIPFNYFVGSLYESSTIEDIYNFNKILNRAGIVTTVRTTRGYDIEAACGQLVGKVLKKGEK